MRRKDLKLIEALRRVEEFLEMHGELMAPIITSKAHQNFTASRARVVEHMKAQEEFTRAIRAASAIKQRLADRLIRVHMRPIATVARRQLPNVGEFSALTIPRGRRQPTNLVAIGHGMARAAKVHEQTFLDAGLPPEFIEKLEAATEALDGAIAEKGQREGLRMKATGGLRKEGRVAGFALRLLDVLVRGAIEKDDALLDHWGKVSRIAAQAIAPRLGEDSDDTPPGGPTGSDAAPPALPAPAAPAPVIAQPPEAPTAA